MICLSTYAKSYGSIPILDDDGDIARDGIFICSGLMIRVYRIL